MAWTKAKQRAYHKVWSARNKERLRGYRIKRRAKFREEWKAWAKRNPDRVKAHGMKSRIKHREKNRARSAKFNALRGKEYSKRYRTKHPERRRKICAKYRAAHLEQERAYGREYAKKYPEKLAAAAAKRRAMLLQVTPCWSDRRRIAVVYRDATRLTKIFGFAWEVDHIWPLKGKDGSRGLHVHENLHAVPYWLNRSKGNRPPL